MCGQAPPRRGPNLAARPPQCRADSRRRSRGAAKSTKALNDNMGEVTGAEFEAARAAGLSDGEIVEVIAVVAINILTNLLGKATVVDIDFPKVELMPRPFKAAA
jgi:alkylhydroperoxidase family enzyme